MIEGILYKLGEKVKIRGLYVCVPCGYKRRLKRGNVFPSCIGCMSVSRWVTNDEFLEAEAMGEEVDEFDEEACAPDLEIWELLKVG